MTVRRYRTIFFLSCLIFFVATPLATFAQSNLSGVFPDDNTLVGYWPLDDQFGTTAADVTTNNNDATLNGSSLWVAGKINGALSFGQSTGYASVPQDSALNFGMNSFSVGTWFKTSVVTFGHLISNQSFTGSPGWRLVISSGQLAFRISDGITQVVTPNSQPENDGNWHFALAVVDRNANMVHLYIDGTEVGNGTSISSVGSVQNSNAQLDFAAVNNNGTPGQFFTGTLDEIRIYNQALSAGQGIQVMNDPGLAPPPPIGAPIISNLSISNITASGATMTWTTDQLSDSHIDYGLTNVYGSIGGQGGISVTSHTATLSGLNPGTLYYFRARSSNTNGAGVSNGQTFTTLVGNALPSISSFSANPSSIGNGQSTILSWSVSGANAISIDNGVGNQGSGGSGSVSTSPAQTTTYTLSANNANGTTTSQTTVTVNGTLTPVIPVSNCAVGPVGTLGTFTVPENFGINYQDQIIDFDYNGPCYSDMYMLDSNGNEVPFQRLSNGKLAVRITLNARTTQTFTLKSGRNPAATYSDQVNLSQSAGYYQISNGVTGARVVNGSGLTAGQRDFEPVQGIALQNGSWSPAGGVIDALRGDNVVLGPLTATNVSTTILENGPLRVVLEVSYSYPGSNFYYSPSTPVPSGAGYFNSIITLEAGQPSILVEDATNMNLDYRVNIYPQVQPNQGRYAGPGATNAAYGYEPGQPSVTYTGVQSNNWHDGFRNFDYTRAVTAGGSSDVGSLSSIPLASPWSLWEKDTGYYWMLYNSSGGSNAPVVGAFVGLPSRAIGVNATGFSPYVLPNDGTGNPAAGFEFMSSRRAADASYNSDTRYDWGIFVGTQGNDLGNPYSVQNIDHQMNVHGFINLNKTYRYQLTFNDPANGYGRLYNDPSVVQGIITKLRSGGAAATAYYTYLTHADPYAQPLIDMWADPTGVKTHAEVNTISGKVQSFLNTYINGAGVFTTGDSYWEGGGTLAQQLPFIDSALADPTLSAQDKAALKTDASVIAYILYDDDYVPMDTFQSTPASGISPGNLNMYTQQLGFRNEYTLWMPQHPAVSAFASQAKSSAQQALNSLVVNDGATACSPHYTEPCIEPTLVTLLQAKMAGTDYFATDQPLMNNLGQFLMQWLTPPDPRHKVTLDAYHTVAVPRQDVEEGDGQTEGHAYTGILAQGFRDANPTLAAQLMGAWISSGKVESDFAGTTIAMINENAPSQDPQLTTANFPGYMSVLRNGWDTPQENAAWLFNGDVLSANPGHRHDDRGDVVLYSLDAPLSLNWSSFYSPPATGGNMASIVMPDTSYTPIAWNANGQSTAGDSSNWLSSTNDNFQAYSQSSMSNGKMVNTNGLDWERKLYSIYADSSLPIIMVKDDFTGNTGGGKVMTWNLMAQGSVTTPVGSITPPTSFEQNTGEVPADTFPSVSQTISLGAGINQFLFTGQTMAQHPTQGINWDLYTIADETQQAVIGNWGDAEANESQDILRVHGNDGFWTLILPYDKGTRPSDLSVTQDPTTKDIIISYSGKVIRANEHYYSYSDGTKTILTSFDNSSVAGNSMSISGGSMEITTVGNTATAVFSGAAGVRTFTLPLSFPSVNGVINNGTNYSYSYSGGNPVTIQLSGNGQPTQPTSTPPVVLPAPIISAITAGNITQNTATITFNTDIAGTTLVEYGLTGAYGQSTTLNSVLTLSHSAMLSNLSGGATYHFRVHSQNASGTEAISLDNTFTTTQSLVPDTTPPNAIGTLAVSNIGENAANLSFSAPGDPDDPIVASYDIRYSTSPLTSSNWAQAIQAGGEPIPMLPGTAQAYVLVGLTPQTTYYAALTSADAAGNVSSLSNIVSFTTAAALPSTSTSTPPVTPVTPVVSNFSAVSLNGQILLSWTNPTGNALFVRTRIVRKAGTVAPAGPTDGTILYEGTLQSFVDTGLTNGSKYSYSAFIILPTGAAPQPSASVAAVTPLATQNQTTLLPANTSSTQSSFSGNANLLAQLEALCVQLFKASNHVSGLSFGSQGNDVWALQVLLMLDGKGSASINLLHRGPTGNYGALTVSAVTEYQTSMGITPASGYFGPKTRAALIGN